MATNQGPGVPTIPATAPTEDLPPPYSDVVGNSPYGFVVPGGEPFPSADGPYMPSQQKQFPTPSGYPHPQPSVYPHPHPSITVTSAQPQGSDGIQMQAAGVPVGIVLPPAVGTEPTTVTCFNCGKLVTTRVTYTTAWHTHLVAGSVCVITMMCSLCCLGLIPYCFDTFKDAEHYCPNCNSFIGKNSKC